LAPYVTAAYFGVTDGQDARVGIASNGLATISFLGEDGTLAGSGHSNGINAIQYDRPNGLLKLRTNNSDKFTLDQNGFMNVAASYVTVARFGVTDGQDARVGIASNGLATISFLGEDGTLAGSGHSNGVNAIQYDRGSGVLSLRTNNTNQLTINQNGTITVKVLQITGGADLAEPFAVNDAANVEPGTVVVLDPDHPGELRVAKGAYDPLVAGVISGAGDIQPGLIMQEEDATINGEMHPMALTGKVYVKAVGPVTVGNLLTTSDVAGHAMAATDRDKAFGATLGKAMSALVEGETGLVLVLVALQ
jgi:hypothetical protein